MLLHCPKKSNSLNKIPSVHVTVAVDTTEYAWFMCEILYSYIRVERFLKIKIDAPLVVPNC